MVDEVNANDRVGYKRPPVATRFKPGKSGNPTGRPKQKKKLNLLDLINEELTTKVTVVQEGRRLRLPLAKVVARKLVRDLASGQPKAMALYLAVARQFQEQVEDDASSTASDHEADDRMLRDYISRSMQESTDG